MYQQCIASLCFVSGPEQGQVIPITKSSIIIGRDPVNSDVVVKDPTVSGMHIRLSCNNDLWTIEQIKPNTIVTVNTQQVQQATVKDHDTIGIGKDTTFSFLITIPKHAPSSPSTDKTQIGSLPGAPAIPSIEISSNTNTNLKKRTQSLSNVQVINIGRDPSNDIVIDELVISKFHLQIRQENNQWVIVHPPSGQKSTLNGLIYQGGYIKGTQPFRKILARGDVFRIGNEFGTLVTLAYNDGSGSSQDIIPIIHPIVLGAAEITLGRATKNTIMLNHPQVSAFHARLIQEKGTYRIIDMGSTNHVYINGQLVTNRLLKVGDEIRIGPFKFTYDGNVLTQQDESKSIRIDALNLRKIGDKQTILLNDISFAISPRKFVALVGGSGYGKSTLMDALNGLRPAHQGQVLYNGQDYYTSFSAFSTQLGYVPQDDIVHRDLSVEKALYYAARLRLPSDFTNMQIQQRIDEVLDDVEMKYRRKLLIRELSGGQRKRVSIALELLAKPSVFFLDEPTSGLDPGLDRKMMLLLRKLADKGHTIILVTHATNNIAVCDYVCFLCKGGRLAYFGPPDEATTYFGQADFADIYSALEPTEQVPDIPEKAELRFKNSSEYQKYVVAPLQQRPKSNVISQKGGRILPKRGKLLQQFLLLSIRYAELLKNDIGNLMILLLQAPIIGLLLIIIVKYVLKNDPFNTSQPGIDAEKTLFIMAFAAVLFGSSNATREIVKELPIYRRERAVNLGIIPYMFSKIVVLGILCVLQCLVLVFMVNAASPFQQSIFLPTTTEISITMVLTSFSGLMLGLTTSAIAPNIDRAANFIPIILIPQVIFSGVIFKTDGIAQALAGFFASRWAMVGMGSSIGLNGDQIGADSFAFEHISGHLLLSWFMLALMCVILGCATGYFLKQKDARTK